MEDAILDLTFILVSYHSRAPLERFFASYRRHRPAASHEILVVDNAPGDGTGEWLAAEVPEARVLTMAGNVGYARAVNAALAQARGRFLLVINPDVEVGEGGVDAALDYLRAHPEAGLVGARLLNDDGSLQRSARRFYTLSTILLRRTPLGRLFPRHPELRRHLMLDDDLERARPVDWVTGAWMLARREAVDDVGPMDGRFFLYFEDVDWCYRMWSGGWEVHYFPGASFVHQHERSSTRPGRTLLYHLRSFVSFYDKWGALIYVAKRMRSRWEKLTAFLVDMVLLNLSFGAAWLARLALDPVLPLPLYSFDNYLPLLASTNVVAAVVLVLAGRYRRREEERPLSRWIDGGRLALILTLLLMAGTWLSNTRTFSRLVIALLLPIWTVGLELSRALRRRLLGGPGTGRAGPVRALLVGEAGAVASLAGEVEGAEGLVVAGAVTPAAAPARAGLRRLGAVGDLVEVAEAYRIGEILAPPAGEGEEILAAVGEAAAGGLTVLVAHPWAAALQGAPGTVVRHGRTWWELRPPAVCAEGAWWKEVMDRPLGLSLCLVALPGHLLCWLLGRPLRLVSSRRLERLGQRRRVLAWPEWVSRRSGRPLPGVVQLPRFLQVAAGRLSLVGPHPLPPAAEEELGPSHLLRFAVKPGLCGLWPRRSERSVEPLVAEDRRYLQRWSWILDLDLFLTSLPWILFSRQGWHRVPPAPSEQDSP